MNNIGCLFSRCPFRLRDTTTNSDKYIKRGMAVVVVVVDFRFKIAYSEVKHNLVANIFHIVRFEDADYLQQPIWINDLIQNTFSLCIELGWCAFWNIGPLPIIMKWEIVVDFGPRKMHLKWNDFGICCCCCCLSYRSRLPCFWFIFQIFFFFFIQLNFVCGFGFKGTSFNCFFFFFSFVFWLQRIVNSRILYKYLVNST